MRHLGRSILSNILRNMLNNLRWDIKANSSLTNRTRLARRMPHPPLPNTLPTLRCRAGENLHRCLRVSHGHRHRPLSNSSKCTISSSKQLGRHPIKRRPRARSRLFRRSLHGVLSTASKPSPRSAVRSLHSSTTPGRRRVPASSRTRSTCENPAGLQSMAATRRRAPQPAWSTISTPVPSAADLDMRRLRNKTPDAPASRFPRLRPQPSHHMPDTPTPLALLNKLEPTQDGATPP